jgi:hypothetical protein
VFPTPSAFSPLFVFWIRKRLELRRLVVVKSLAKLQKEVANVGFPRVFGEKVRSPWKKRWVGINIKQLKLSVGQDLLQRPEAF